MITEKMVLMYERIDTFFFHQGKEGINFRLHELSYHSDI